MFWVPRALERSAFHEQGHHDCARMRASPDMDSLGAMK